MENITEAAKAAKAKAKAKAAKAKAKAAGVKTPRPRTTPGPVATSKRIKLIEPIKSFDTGSVITQSPAAMAHQVKTGRAEYTTDDYITIRVKRS